MGGACILKKLHIASLYYYFERFFIKKNLKSSLLLDIRIFFSFFFKHNPNSIVPVIISLTSYPARIKTVKYTIFSLLRQNFVPEKIVLWLAEEQFPEGKGIPSSLFKMQGNLFEIKFTDDIKSYKKLIPALKQYPEKVIVTADDDVYYKKDWLKILWNAFQIHPDDIIAHRGYEIKCKDNAVLPYSDWGAMKRDTESQYNFFTGAGGVLYPPSSLYQDVCNSELFMNLAPFADDIWFYFMTILKGRKIYFPADAVFSLIDTDKGIRQEKNNKYTLSKINVGTNKNDEQFKAVFDYYFAHPVIKNYFERNDK